MAVIEITESSIDKQKEAYESSKKEINELKKEIMENENISKEDLDEFIRGTQKDLNVYIDKAKEMWLSVVEESAVKAAFSSLLIKIEEHPDRYLEKSEGYHGGYHVKKEPFLRWFNDLARDTRKVLIKYDLVG